MLLSLLSCGLNTTSTWSSVVEKEGKVKQWLIINALSSALDGKRWYYSNIQCEACSAEHDCQLSFISLLEGIRLLQILPVYAVRSSTILSTEYWWHHSKISLVCWEDAFSWDFDEQLSKKFPLFVPCRDVWILNSYFKCKIMKKKSSISPGELSYLSHIHLLRLEYEWALSNWCTQTYPHRTSI